MFKLAVHDVLYGLFGFSLTICVGLSGWGLSEAWEGRPGLRDCTNKHLVLIFHHCDCSGYRCDRHSHVSSYHLISLSYRIVSYLISLSYLLHQPKGGSQDPCRGHISPVHNGTFAIGKWLWINNIISPWYEAVSDMGPVWVQNEE